MINKIYQEAKTERAKYKDAFNSFCVRKYTEEKNNDNDEREPKRRRKADKVVVCNDLLSGYNSARVVVTGDQAEV